MLLLFVPPSSLPLPLPLSLHCSDLLSWKMLAGAALKKWWPSLTEEKGVSLVHFLHAWIRGSSMKNCRMTRIRKGFPAYTDNEPVLTAGIQHRVTLWRGVPFWNLMERCRHKALAAGVWSLTVWLSAAADVFRYDVFRYISFYEHSCQIILKPLPTFSCFSFQDFDIQGSRRCSLDWLTIETYKNIESYRACGSTVPPPYISSQDHVWIRFHSDDSMSRKGFRLAYFSGVVLTALHF